MRRASAQEREDLLRSQQNALLLDKMLSSNQIDYAAIVDNMPGILHLNAKDNLEIRLLNKHTEELIGVSNEEVVEMGVEFFARFLHAETVERVIPKFLEFYRRNDTNAVCAQFQYVKFREGWSWMYTCAKIQKDADCYISLSLPLSYMGKEAMKIERLLGEHFFVRKHYQKFASLTKTEKDILAQIATGLTNKEIADRMFISVETVKTHRKRIKGKLEAKNFVQLIRFASAFGLLDDLDQGLKSEM